MHKLNIWNVKMESVYFKIRIYIWLCVHFKVTIYLKWKGSKSNSNRGKDIIVIQIIFYILSFFFSRQQNILGQITPSNFDLFSILSLNFLLFFFFFFLIQSFNFNFLSIQYFHPLPSSGLSLRAQNKIVLNFFPL